MSLSQCALETKSSSFPILYGEIAVGKRGTKVDVFSVLHKTCCGYALEAPLSEALLMSTHKHKRSSKNEKKKNI